MRFFPTTTIKFPSPSEGEGRAVGFWEKCSVPDATYYAWIAGTWVESTASFAAWGN